MLKSEEDPPVPHPTTRSNGISRRPSWHDTSPGHQPCRNRASSRGSAGAEDDRRLPRSTNSTAWPFRARANPIVAPPTPVPMTATSQAPTRADYFLKGETPEPFGFGRFYARIARPGCTGTMCPFYFLVVLFLLSLLTIAARDRGLGSPVTRGNGPVDRSCPPPYPFTTPLANESQVEEMTVDSGVRPTRSVEISISPAAAIK